MLFLKCVGSNTKLFMRDVVTCAWRRGHTKSLLSVSLVIALLYMTLENTH